MKVLEAFELYNELKALKDLSKVSSKERIAVVKNICALKNVVEDFRTFDIELQEKLKPEGFDDLLAKVVENQKTVKAGKQPTISNEELAEFALLDKQFASVYLKPKREKEMEEIDIAIAKISPDSFDRICMENKLNAGQCSVIYGIVE